MRRGERIAKFLMEAEDRLGPQLAVILGWLAVAAGLEGVGQAFGLGLERFGIRPGEAAGLTGIPLAPFLHGGWAHLFSNASVLVPLALVVLQAGWRTFGWATALSVLGAGLGAWMFGDANLVHLGASGVAFGYLAFVLMQGIRRREVGWSVAAIGVLVFYGGLLVGLGRGWEASISWAGHMGGFVGGGLSGIVQHVRRRSGPDSC